LIQTWVPFCIRIRAQWGGREGFDTSRVVVAGVNAQNRSA
jgi:hypothetical protein